MITPQTRLQTDHGSVSADATSAMRGRLIGTLIASFAVMLAGCAQDRGGLAGVPAATGEKISIAVGPCFGFCPVYSTSIASNGAVHYVGERHTAMLGERDRKLDQAIYRRLQRDLAAFRPADGTESAVECEAAISDTSRYTITWTAPDGRVTTATHQQGCSGGPGQALNKILTTVPDRLGVAAWAKQMTRPGVSRG